MDNIRSSPLNGPANLGRMNMHPEADQIGREKEILIKNCDENRIITCGNVNERDTRTWQGVDTP